MFVSKKTIKQQIEKFKKSFFQSPNLPFNNFLADDDIADIIEHTPHKRNAVFTPLVTLKAFIFQVLGDDGSCKQAVASVLADRVCDGKSANSANTGPYCKARQRLPLAQMKAAATNTGSRLHQRSPEKLKGFGYNVVLADGFTVQMPDTPENQAVFPQPSHQKRGLGFPMIRLVALTSLATGGIINYNLGPYQGKQTGESSLFSHLINGLSLGDLLMADRYYCTFAIIALSQAKNIPVLFQIHASKKVDFRRGQKLGAKDHLVEWQKPKRKPVWMTGEAYADLPDTITAREFSVRGMVYVTTLLDAKKYPKTAIATFYQQRWHMELDIRAIKTHMGMELLRCKTPEMVEKEIAVHMLAYNIIRGNLAQAAILHNKIPRQLSFRSAVQLVLQATKQLIVLKGILLNNVMQALFKAIASTPVGLQKRKNQPRAIKRRPKPYPLLMIPRHEACVIL
jgi:hypothetical protein